MLTEILDLLTLSLNYMFRWFVYLYNACGIDVVGVIIMGFGILCALRVLSNGVPSLLSYHHLDRPSGNYNRPSGNYNRSISEDKIIYVDNYEEL